MIKLVVSTKIVFSFLFLFLSTSSFAQIIDKFNHENFTVEIKKEFLSTSEQLYDPFVIETAISNWNNKLNEEEKHMFLRIVNYLNYNDQRNYFSCSLMKKVMDLLVACIIIYTNTEVLCSTFHLF